MQDASIRSVPGRPAGPSPGVSVDRVSVRAAGDAITRQAHEWIDGHADRDDREELLDLARDTWMRTAAAAGDAAGVPADQLVGRWCPLGVGKQWELPGSGVCLPPLEKCRAIPGGERRGRARVPALLLSADERHYARRLLSSCAACRTMGAVLERWRPTQGSFQLMAITVGCHTRVCSDCFSRIREVHEQRVKGPWIQLLTLGIPSGDISLRESWGMIHRAVSKFNQLLRGFLRWGSDDIRVEGGGKFQYAWCVESHLSGYPHVHLAHNLAWLERERAIEAWSIATALEIKRIHQSRVRDDSGMSRYLVKYLTDAELPLDILVLMKGKHLIGSTIRRAKVDPSGWRLLRMEGVDKIAAILAGKSEHLVRVGATVKEGVPGCYCLWNIPGHFEVPTDMEESGDTAGIMWRWIMREVVDIREELARVEDQLDAWHAKKRVDSWVYENTKGDHWDEAGWVCGGKAVQREDGFRAPVG